MTILTYIPQTSSFIRYIAYDVNSCRLAVTFKSLTLWIYHDVPFEVYQSLILSESIGNYFNKNIRNIYNSIKIDNLHNFNKLITSVMKEDYLGEKEK